MAETPLYFVSKNRQKFEEYRELLAPIDLRWSQLSVRESQSLNLELLVEDKVQQIRGTLPDARFFVEHTGLVIHAWNGLPGGLTAVFMETVGNAGICRMLRSYHGPERRAIARVVIGYHHPVHGIRTFFGEANGSIAQDPRGPEQFGWDPIFIPEGDSRTYGEMSRDEKNRTSMRRDAASKLRKHLDTELPSRTARVFVCYAHADAALWEEFQTHLKGLELRGVITVWSDPAITAGADWRARIQAALDEADVFLLLVSPDFVASEFCTGPELERALARHEAGRALIVPVLLRDAAWDRLPFARFQALPPGAVPVARSSNHDRGFAEVVRGLEDALRAWGPPTAAS
jgi:non-canonical purine NTP pyrophosphatase (RdgB/HAM1 family)